MIPNLRFVLFFAVFVAVVAGLHLYLWRRLVRDTRLPRRWHAGFTVAMAALALSVVASFFLVRIVPASAGRFLMFPIYLWMGAVFYLLLIVLGADLMRLLVRAARRPLREAPAADPGRRRFLARLVGGGASASFAGIAFVGSRKAMELGDIVTRKVEVPLRRLPRALDGFRIVQISDLHLGPTLDRAWCEGVVERVNALAPDLIAITGDVIDGSVERLRGDVEPLSRLRSRHGSFFCTGNHEYYFGPAEWCEHLASLGIRVLRNERVTIGDGGDSFDLAGIDDHRSKGMAEGHGPDLARAVEGRDEKRELVLLAHQPVAVLEAAEHGVGLQLSGHTHGGQMWPFHYLVFLSQPYVSGLVNHKGTMLYVNQGTGFWGPPIRIGTFAEITEVTLRTA